MQPVYHDVTFQGRQGGLDGVVSQGRQGVVEGLGTGFRVVPGLGGPGGGKFGGQGTSGDTHLGLQGQLGLGGLMTPSGIIGGGSSFHVW